MIGPKAVSDFQTLINLFAIITVYCIFIIVRKGKSKTPAQDRLQKYVGKNKAVIADSLKELVDTKSSVSHLPRNKPSTIATHVPNVKSVIVKCTYVGVAVDSVESKKKLENNGSIVTDVIQKAKSIEMPLSDLSNFPPLNPKKFSIQNQMQSSTTDTTNNHWDTQVQSHLKINDKSRAIGGKYFPKRERKIV